MNNKICFLDADGCINSEQWYRSHEYYLNLFKDPDIDPHIVDRINQFTNETGVKLVISSSWKIDDNCIERLGRAGLDNIIGRTPNLIFTVPYDKFCKGMEIQSWLMTHNIDKYIILDDELDSVLNEQKPNFLLINYKVGITEEDIKYCKQWFK